jgi:hypothetical protein
MMVEAGNGVADAGGLTLYMDLGELANEYRMTLAKPGTLSEVVPMVEGAEVA